jgi:hypothetical protein
MVLLLESNRCGPLLTVADHCKPLIQQGEEPYVNDFDSFARAGSCSSSNNKQQTVVSVHIPQSYIECLQRSSYTLLQAQVLDVSTVATAACLRRGCASVCFA